MPKKQYGLWIVRKDRFLYEDKEPFAFDSPDDVEEFKNIVIGETEVREIKE